MDTPMLNYWQKPIYQLSVNTGYRLEDLVLWPIWTDSKRVKRESGMLAPFDDNIESSCCEYIN